MHDAVSNRGLLIHAGALGDTLLALRVVAAMRSGRIAHVTLLARTAYANLACPGVVDAVIDIDRAGYALFTEDLPLYEPLADAVRQSTLIVNMLGGSMVKQRLTRGGARRVIDIDPRPRDEWEGHVTDQWLHDLRAGRLEFPDKVPMPGLEIESRLSTNRLIDRRRGSVVLAPGSGSRSKCWPLDRFVPLAERFQADGLDPIFLLGPVEKEWLDAASRDRLAGAADVLDGLTVANAASLIASARACVGNDSGISHLAAMAGTPTTVIFGPTSPRRWRPLGPRVSIVSTVGGEWPEVDDVVAALRTNC